MSFQSRQQEEFLLDPRAQFGKKLPKEKPPLIGIYPVAAIGVALMLVLCGRHSANVVLIESVVCGGVHHFIHHSDVDLEG